MFKLVLEKAEEPEVKLPTSAGSWKKAREFQKNIYFCCIDYAKARDCVDYNAAAAAAPKYCGKFWKRREYQTTWPTSWETCMQVRKHMEQQTGSKEEKEYVKAVYCHPVCFIRLR